MGHHYYFLHFVSHFQRCPLWALIRTTLFHYHHDNAKNNCFTYLGSLGIAITNRIVSIYYHEVQGTKVSRVNVADVNVLKSANVNYPLEWSTKKY